jgi:hypothetical protein
MRIVFKGYAEKADAATQFEGKVLPLGLDRLDEGRLIPRRLEYAAQEHRTIDDVCPCSLGECIQTRVGEIAVRASVVEKEFHAGHEISPGDALYSIERFEALGPGPSTDSGIDLLV